MPRAPRGADAVAYFDSLGLFDAPVTAAHCVWVDEADLDILAAHGVFVANNPASNMKLGSGFAPIPEMLRRGIPVCLGSDGMASNNNHNLFHDMYLQALIYKGATLDPTAVTPQQALAAATRTGALSQGRTDCGMVAEGARADLCVLDITDPSWCPAPDPVYNLVYAGRRRRCGAYDVRRPGHLPRCSRRRVAHHRCRARQSRMRRPHRPHYQRALTPSRLRPPHATLRDLHPRPPSGRTRARTPTAWRKLMAGHNRRFGTRGGSFAVGAGRNRGLVP